MWPCFYGLGHGGEKKEVIFDFLEGLFLFVKHENSPSCSRSTWNLDPLLCISFCPILCHCPVCAGSSIEQWTKYGAQGQETWVGIPPMPINP